MKFLTTIFALLLGTVMLSAQEPVPLLDKKLSITIKDQPIEQILKQLEKLADFTSAYSTRSVDVKVKRSLNVQQEKLSSILQRLFPEGKVRFRSVGKKLLIYKKGDANDIPQTALFQTVRGVVIDLETRQPIPGANVFIPGSSPIIGAVSDVDGRFKIEQVPVGRYNFQVTFMGYRPKGYTNLSVDAGKEVVLNIEMEESVTSLASVEVVAELDKSRPLNEMALISAKSFSVEETSRYAGSFNDPARMATSYAGVVGSADDTENSIIIRGNSPRGLLWRLEGLEIPNPNHFASDGSSNGAISMLNSNVLTNSDFLTGAFPAEYGNAFSGVFDLKLRNGNNEKREYALQAGLLGLDASLEGPIRLANRKNVANPSYLINYRYSTISILESLGLNLAEEGNQVPAFQDLAFKFHVPTAKAGTFSWYGLGGFSDTEDQEGILRDGQEFNVKAREDYKLGLTGLSHVINTGKKGYLESAFSYAVYDYEYFEEDVFESEFFTSDIEKYTNSNLRLSTSYNTKFNARHSTKFGAIYTRFGYDLDSEGFLPDRSPSYSVNEDGAFGMWQAYVSHKLDLTDQLTLTGGFHYLHLDIAGQHSFEPRFGLRWQFKPDQSLSFGFGVHSRKEETSLYFTELALPGGGTFQPNLGLDLARARHFVVGYDRNFGSDFYLKLEAYYQDLYNIPVAIDPISQYSSLNQENAFQRFHLVNEGSGENYGLELTLEKFMSRGYFFLLTGALYRSTYETQTGETYSTRYDGRYNTSLVAGKEFQLGSSNKQKTLNLGFEGVLGGGNRVREIDLQSSIDQGQTVFFLDRPFARQLKDYTRLDFQIALKTNKKNVTHELKLDIQNLTGRSNVLGERFDPTTNMIKQSQFTGELIPVLSYKIIF